jgi:dTDP-4-dehydrorhamnose 3,5-epimerase
MKTSSIVGLQVIDIDPAVDDRGTFYKLFSEQLMRDLDFHFEISQVNLSLTNNVGTIRGLHFQTPPYCETKLIRCIRGKIYDVIVDLRHGSSTFLDYQAFELSSASSQILLIPEGCAHGFQVLEGPAEIAYVHSQEYMREYEDGIHPLDPKIGIPWPISEMTYSPRDSAFARLQDEFRGIECVSKNTDENLNKQDE